MEKMKFLFYFFVKSSMNPLTFLHPQSLVKSLILTSTNPPKRLMGVYKEKVADVHKSSGDPQNINLPNLGPFNFA